ncbi:MAG: phosphoribosyltransferase family protein [Casimicrobiaceae bacterium]|nr:phosphoribosyltransferase family protein [Casimicrobiaceae bacterium]
MDQLLLRAKYGADFSALSWLAERAACERACFAAPVLTIIPIPLGPQRLVRRGYNQTAEIARALARAPAWHRDRLDLHALIRIRDTAVQQSLSWTERRANVRGAFAATRSLVGEHVLLVDDVLTTGATLNECARAVRRAGAVAVDGLVLARVDPPARRHRIQRFGRTVA